MTFHGLGVLVFSTILCGSFVASHRGIDVAPARENIRELTKSLDTVFPDAASSQETGESLLGPALPLSKLESDVDPDSQDGGKLVHSVLSASHDRLKRMAGTWSTGTRRNQKHRSAKKGHQFLQDDSNDDDEDAGCSSSSSSSSSESSEIPPVSFQRGGHSRGQWGRNSRRGRLGGKFGGGSHASNRKKKNRCRKHRPNVTTISGRVTTKMITSLTTTTASPTTKLTMTSPKVAPESLTEALIMTTPTSSKPTREETTTVATKTRPTEEPTAQTESSTTVTYQSTTEEVKTVGVLEPK